MKPNQTKSYKFIYKADLALNSLPLLICHETQPNQTNHFFSFFPFGGGGIWGIFIQSIQFSPKIMYSDLL